MAERIADNADLAVDELRRKARRRLVGAVVLALAAAVILPLLLEKDPKPLGDDVSVQIPPVDEGRLLASLIPDCRFVQLDSQNHMLLPGEPAWQRFLEEMRRFLAEPDAAGAGGRADPQTVL